MEKLRLLDPPATIEAHVVGDGKAVVVLSGIVDASARDSLEEAFSFAIAPEMDELVVDLSRTTMVDSVALGALVYAAKRVTGAGGGIVFSGANRAVARVFEITGLSRVYRMEHAAVAAST